MKKNIITSLLILFIIPGCKTSFEESLISKAKDACTASVNNECILSIKDATKFSWDKMYIFEDWTISDTISKAIGFEYQGGDVPDDYSRILFVEKSEVVHEEDFESLDYNNSTISFSSNDSVHKIKSFYFTPANAIFKVEKEKIEGSCKTCFDYNFTWIEHQ